MSDDEWDLKAVAKGYVASKRRIERGEGTWIDHEIVDGLNEYMNGRHPFLNLLSARSPKGPQTTEDQHG